MRDLLENIRQHGVLVAVTVHRLPGQSKFALLDGARRHRCCLTLLEEGQRVLLPANVVEPPDKLASLLSMFSIHNLREQWELMPTAISLGVIISNLGESDSRKLAHLTGMSEPQIERCKKLLLVPKRFQDLSLLTDPAERIPANLWIESLPVLQLWEEHAAADAVALTTDGFFDAITAKYQAKAIKSVIHFRRIVEAFERQADDPVELKKVTDTLRAFLTDVDLETRKAFDHFVVDDRRVDGVIGACDSFLRSLRRHRAGLSIDRRDELQRALLEVQREVAATLVSLEGKDAPHSLDRPDKGRR